MVEQLATIISSNSLKYHYQLHAIKTLKLVIHIPNIPYHYNASKLWTLRDVSIWGPDRES